MHGRPTSALQPTPFPSLLLLYKKNKKPKKNRRAARAEFYALRPEISFSFGPKKSHSFPPPLSKTKNQKKIDALHAPNFYFGTRQTSFSSSHSLKNQKKVGALRAPNFPRCTIERLSFFGRLPLSHVPPGRLCNALL